MPVVSCVVGGHPAICISCRHAGRRLATQLVESAQTVFLAQRSSTSGEPLAVTLPGAGLLPRLCYPRARRIPSLQGRGWRQKSTAPAVVSDDWLNPSSTPSRSPHGKRALLGSEERSARRGGRRVARARRRQPALNRGALTTELFRMRHHTWFVCNQLSWRPRPRRRRHH